MADRPDTTKPAEGSETFIVKVQRPLTSNDPTPHVLIYNEDRSVLYETDMSKKDIRNLFGRNEYKVYVNAELRGTILHLGDRVEDQPW